MHISFNNDKDMTGYAIFHKRVFCTTYGEEVEVIGIEDIRDNESLAQCSINEMIHKQDTATHINDPYLFDRTIENGVITFTKKPCLGRIKCTNTIPIEIHAYWYEKVKLELCSPKKHAE